MLAAAIDELEDLGTAGGGAPDAKTRRAALERYRGFAGTREPVPARWRHPYGALPLRDLSWGSGRIRVPAAGRAAGLVHAGATYLEPPEAAGDPRMTLSTLADARRRRPQRLEGVYRTIVAPDADRFVALSNAFQNCGAFVDVPAGVHLEAPIPLVWTARPGPHAAVFPHTVVRLGERSRATIVERHLGDNEAFVSGIVEIELAAGAHLDYVVIQQADDGSRLIMRRGARCAGSATIGWHSAELGAALSRSRFDARLAGAGARGEYGAVVFTGGFTNVDLALNIAHDAADTSSRTTVRSVAKDHSIGRFLGDVHIGPQAHGARAAMRADALVLSRDAYVEAVPSLEIRNADVSASHAATVGSLDEEQLFYAQSRGIDRSSAERMVALAFFEPALAGFPSEALRDEIRAALDARLDEVPQTFE